MKAQNIKFMTLLTILAIVSLVFTTTKADYEIVQNTIDGGGGTSSGGQYVVMGTTGQPEAGEMSGGQYELLGGFWPAEPLCVVDFQHFARFADWWLYIGDCPADLYDDDTINGLDLNAFVYEWLYYCPYDWPLK